MCRSIFLPPKQYTDLPGGSDGKASAYNVEDLGSIPSLERSPGEGNGNPPQYSCLENPMDGGTWKATMYGVAKKPDMTERLHTFKQYTVKRVDVLDCRWYGFRNRSIHMFFKNFILCVSL